MNHNYVPNIQVQIHGNANKELADIIILDVHGAVGHDPKKNRDQQFAMFSHLQKQLQTDSPEDIYADAKKNNTIAELPHYAGDSLLTLQWLSAAFDSNEIDDLLDYLQLEHDFGIWKLTTATTKILEKKTPNKKIIQIKVLQNRGVLDANRLHAEFSVRNTFDHQKYPELHKAMSDYNQSVLDEVDRLLAKLEPSGFLFIPHSMNRMSKYLSEDLMHNESPGKLRDYVTNFTQPLAAERQDMYIDEDIDGNKLGHAAFYENLKKGFAEAKKTLLVNDPYRATAVSSSTRYLTNYPRSGVIEVRKDNVAILDYPDQAYSSHLMTATDPIKIKTYAELYAEAILAS
jgi:hypothetical protein